MRYRESLVAIATVVLATLSVASVAFGEPYPKEQQIQADGFRDLANLALGPRLQVCEADSDIVQR